MSRPVTVLAFFFIALSLFSGALQATGIADTLQLTQRTAGGDTVDSAQSTAADIQTGAPTASTLFGLYNVLGNQVASLLGVINPGLRMLYNVGVPAWLVGGPNTVGLLPPLTSFIKAIGLISFLRGWGL